MMEHKKIDRRLLYKACWESGMLVTPAKVLPKPVAKIILSDEQGKKYAVSKGLRVEPVCDTDSKLFSRLAAIRAKVSREQAAAFLQKEIAAGRIEVLVTEGSGAGEATLAKVKRTVIRPERPLRGAKRAATRDTDSKARRAVKE